MKSQWTNTHPDKKTRRLLKMHDIYERDCYAILTYDIMIARKKIRCWVVHLDAKRKQLVIRISNEPFIRSFLKEEWSHGNTSIEETPVTISLITAYVSFILFVVIFNTSIVIGYDRNLVFNFQEIKKINMRDEQKILRRHLDSDNANDDEE